MLYILGLLKECLYQSSVRDGGCLHDGEMSSHRAARDAHVFTFNCVLVGSCGLENAIPLLSNRRILGLCFIPRQVDWYQTSK